MLAFISVPKFGKIIIKWMDIKATCVFVNDIVYVSSYCICFNASSSIEDLFWLLKHFAKSYVQTSLVRLHGPHTGVLQL